MSTQLKRSSEQSPTGAPLPRVPKVRWLRRLTFRLFVCWFAVVTLAVCLSVREWRQANRALEAADELTDGGYLEQAEVVLAGYDNLRSHSRPLVAVWSRATDSRARAIRDRLDKKYVEAVIARSRRPSFTPTFATANWSERQQLNHRDVDLAAWSRAIEHYPVVTRPLAHEFAVAWAMHYAAWCDIQIAGMRDSRVGIQLLPESTLVDLREKPPLLTKLVRATAADFVAAGSPLSCADLSRRVTVVLANHSQCACTVMINGVGPEANGSWWFWLEDGSVRPRFVTPGTFHLKAVVVERGGERVRREVNAELPPGTTHEIRIGADDRVDVIAVPSD